MCPVVENMIEGNTICLDSTKIVADFDIILMVLYEDDLGDYAPETYVKILNTLDYLCYTTTSIITKIVHKITPCITDFSQIVDLPIDNAHKIHLINHFIYTVYDKNPSSYTLGTLISFYNLIAASIYPPHELDTDTHYDLILNRMARKIYDLDTLLSLPIKKIDKIVCMQHYLNIYTSENVIELYYSFGEIHESHDNTPKLREPIIKSRHCLGVHSYTILKNGADGFKCESIDNI